jgi:hypothetical protein
MSDPKKMDEMDASVLNNDQCVKVPEQYPRPVAGIPGDQTWVSKRPEKL